MKIACAGAALSCLFLLGCSHSDTEHAKAEARQAGQEAKQELKKAGQELKQDLHAAGREIKKGVNDAKSEIREKRDERR